MIKFFLNRSSLLLAWEMNPEHRLTARETRHLKMDKLFLILGAHSRSRVQSVTIKSLQILAESGDFHRIPAWVVTDINYGMAPNIDHTPNSTQKLC